ncbi:hypothetical protein [Parasphingorhabdus sp.]|uniref:hypothetical protein n=1 Tax=Parasphingorhabdus sp. TaxID=2709688 RepID=UPI003A8F12A8
MTFQDEFVHRLRVVQDGVTGDDPSILRQAQDSGRTDESEKRHPEFISGPLAGAPEDRRERHEVLKRVQDDEVPSPTTRHDGWLPEIRVKFLETLARTGNVGAAAHYVQRSRQTAYDLKRRDRDFARAWLAALVLAREEAQDALQERAIEGIEEEIFYHGEVVATRRRHDARLLLAHLARLDKIAADIPAQRGAARFADMLAAIGAGEDTAPLIATPTEEERAMQEAAALARAAEREPRPEPEHEPEPEPELEFHAVSWPDQDDPPDYYRMTPREVEQMQRHTPDLVIRPTGTSDDDMIERIYPCATVAEAIGAGMVREKYL